MNSQNVNVATKLKRIRETYLKQLPVQMEAIRTAFNEFISNPPEIDKLEALFRKIHNLKGACASFGLIRLSAAAAAAEHSIKEAMQATAPPESTWVALVQEQLTQMECEATSIDSSEHMDIQTLDIISASENTTGREQKIVYLCEDDSFQRMSLSTQIGCFGFQVIVFGDLEQLYNAVNNSAPDVIVMDLMFSDRALGGAEIISRIQSERETPIPTVFISTQDDFPCRLAAVRAGSNAFFVKPINVTELCTTLSNLTTTDKPEQYRIMIIDDDPHMSALYSTILQGADMETLELNDPLLAISHLADFKPDLILTDMHMPGCNGMELAKTIRQIGSYFSIPIVFLSSETDIDKQFNAMRMGGDEFLTKPIKPEHLISSVAVRAERMKIIRSYMVRDSMTSLFNHTTTKEYLATAVAHAQRKKEELCFAMIDVDKFKGVNDTYGHQVGDIVLKALARLIRQRVRKADIVGRMGGEEFAVILPSCTTSEAAALLNKLRESFAGVSYQAKDEPFSCTFSCGIAPLSKYSDMNAISLAAYEALYAAKKGGRNQVVCAPD